MYIVNHNIKFFFNSYKNRYNSTSINSALYKFSLLFFLVFSFLSQNQVGVSQSISKIDSVDFSGNIDSLGKVIDSLNNLLLSQVSIKFPKISKKELNLPLLKETDIETIYNPEFELISKVYLNDNDIKRIVENLKMAYKSYYGKDDGVAIVDYSLLSQKISHSAKCVCAIIHNKFLLKTPQGYIINAQILGQQEIEYQGKKFFLCPNERFINEINPSNCTGWVYKENLIVTARHCFSDTLNYKDYYFIFDFLETESGKTIPENRVYQPVSLIIPRPNDPRVDFVIIKVNKTIPPDRYPVLDRSSELNKNNFVYMLGHRQGLPLKFTPNGTIFRIYDDVLITNLDAYGGNSGSPVFNAENDKLEGILVSSLNQDYKLFNSSCLRSAPYPDNLPANNGPGERVYRLINILINY